MEVPLVQNHSQNTADSFCLMKKHAVDLFLGNKNILSMQKHPLDIIIRSSSG